MGNAEKVFTLCIVNIVVLCGVSLKEVLVARYIAPNAGRYPTAILVGDVMEVDYGKIGQMLMVGFRGMAVDETHFTVRDIRQHHLGGVILFD